MKKQIVLKSRPVGKPTADNFETRLIEIPTVAEGEVRLVAHTFSVDPYLRGRMSDAKSYIAPFQVGEAIVSGLVAKVVESKAANLKVGDFVMERLPWQEEMVVPAKGLQVVDEKIAPLSYYLGILGMPGLTAYFGLLDIGKPQKGETVVVSGAAGAVGMVVGQIAKIQGCRVVGIAGDDAKNEYLMKELHFDAVINYKTVKNLDKALDTACPSGVDVYFDNVGGEISDAVIAQINKGARIIICGQISLYNATSMPVGPRIQPSLLKRSAMMQGFIVSNYVHRFPEGFKVLAGWVSGGLLKYTNTAYKGFDQLPEAFIALFEGKNLGKLIVEVS
ncbi:MAG: NADP-dependent oxidoreductase [Bacteroidota bacterium]|nr:NADP-dependent oxidoreductase [Bacteroidota bacterium]